MDCSPSGSFDHGISQARTLERIATSPLGDLSNPEIKLKFLVSPALVGGFFTTASPGSPISKSGNIYQSREAVLGPILHLIYLLLSVDSYSFS